LVEASAGNPLVLRSAIGRLRDAAIQELDPTAIDLLGATDLDQELWQRLERVGASCEAMLLDAAFLGDGGNVDLLAAVCDVDTASLDVLIDEASEHQVMITDGDQYWFDHPQLRQLIYHLPPPLERAERHLRVADRISPLGADVLAIAHHMMRAGTLVDPHRILEVCGSAADRATAIGAWREAARYSAAALDAGEKVHAPEEDVAGMQLRAGYAALLGGEREEGLTLLRAAAERAEECRALETWGRALAAIAREQAAMTDHRSQNLRSIERIDSFLALAGDQFPALRAELYALKAELCFDMNDIAAANRNATVAEDMAAELHDDALLVKIAFARGLQQLGALELSDARHTLESVYDLAEKSSDPSARIWCVSRMGLIAYASGDLGRAESRLQEALDLARSVDLATEYSIAAAVAASVSLGQGRLAHVESHADRARRAYEQGEYAFTPIILFPTLAVARAIRGDTVGAREALDDWDALQGRRSRRYRPLVDALAGDVDAARAVMNEPPFRLFTDAPRPDLLLCGAIAAQAELAALVDLPELVEAPLEALRELYERGMRFTVGWPAFIPRVIALATAATGNPRDADEWFDRALSDARSVNATTEIGRTALDHARFLATESESDSLVEQRIQIAREAFQSLSIRPQLPGAAMLEDHVRIGREHDPNDVTRIVLVTDLVGSTELNERLGDHDYLDVLQRHDEIIRSRLAECDGVEFKHTGDGIAAWFLAVNAALRCAVALERDFEERQSELGAPLRVRVALTAGVPSLVDGDLLGVAVTLAFRVADLANPGDVLVTSEVAALARGLHWSFEPIGPRRLKGIRADVDVLRVKAAVPA
jgi:class 3 adenylate cyclase